MKIGFVGFGNMAQAIINGLIATGDYKAKDIMVSDVVKVETAIGVKWGTSNGEVATFADVLILAVKPQQYKEVITEIKDVIDNKTIIVSIAAGLTILTLEELFAKEVKLIRTMPNTPAQIGQGMTAIMPNDIATKEDISAVCEIFDAVGKTQIVTEDLIEAVIVTSGSSPAYIYMMIEAMIEAGVKEGMDRDTASVFVCQAMLGACMMVSSTGLAPADLIKAVCSPNGTTIEAVNHLNEQNFNQILLDAMAASSKRSRELSKL